MTRTIGYIPRVQMSAPKAPSLTSKQQAAEEARALGILLPDDLRHTSERRIRELIAGVEAEIADKASAPTEGTEDESITGLAGDEVPNLADGSGINSEDDAEASSNEGQERESGQDPSGNLEGLSSELGLDEDD